MSESIDGLRKKINSAADLGSVVRTMKALAASSLGQYEKSVYALDEYYRTVEMAICACLRQDIEKQKNKAAIDRTVPAADIIIFGSDQGLVGRFNETISEFAIKQFINFKNKYSIWVVGERVENILSESGITVSGKFSVPNSVRSINPLLGNILTIIQTELLYVIYNQPNPSIIFEPVMIRVWPVDENFQKRLLKMKWPSKNLPTVLGDSDRTLHACMREYIFVSLFRACAQSLAGENASRLASMQRAEKNIEEILDELELFYNRLRQGNIDEELFDVISGFEALIKK